MLVSKRTGARYDGASTASSGSMRGLQDVRLAAFHIFFTATISFKFLHLDTVAKMVKAWKVDMEEIVVVHEVRSNRRRCA